MKKLKRVLSLLLILSLVISIGYSPKITILAEDTEEISTEELEDKKEATTEKEEETERTETVLEEPKTESEEVTTEVVNKETSIEETTESVEQKDANIEETTEASTEAVNDSTNEVNTSEEPLTTDVNDSDTKESKVSEEPIPAESQSVSLSISNPKLNFISEASFYHKEGDIVYYRKGTKIKVTYDKTLKDADGYELLETSLNGYKGTGVDKNEFDVSALKSEGDDTFTVEYYDVKNSVSNPDGTTTIVSVSDDVKTNLNKGFSLQEVADFKGVLKVVSKEINLDATKPLNFSYTNPDDFGAIVNTSKSYINVADKSSINLSSKKVSTVIGENVDIYTSSFEDYIKNNFIPGELCKVSITLVHKNIPGYTITISSVLDVKGANLTYKLSPIEPTNSIVYVGAHQGNERVSMVDSSNNSVMVNVKRSSNSTSMYSYIVRGKTGNNLEVLDVGGDWSSLNSIYVDNDNDYGQCSFLGNSTQDFALDMSFTYMIVSIYSKEPGYSIAFNTLKTGESAPLSNFQSVVNSPNSLITSSFDRYNMTFTKYEGKPALNLLTIGTKNISKGGNLESWINKSIWDGNSPVNLKTERGSLIKELYFGGIQVPFERQENTLVFQIPEEMKEGEFPSNTISVIDLMGNLVEENFPYKSDITPPKVKSVSLSDYSYKDSTGLYYIIDSESEPKVVIEAEDKNGFSANYEFSSSLNGDYTSYTPDVVVTKSGFYIPVVEDAAGNMAENVNDYISEVLIDTKKPVLSANIDSSVVTKSDGTKWSASDVTYSVNAEDEAISELTAKVNDEAITLKTPDDADFSLVASPSKDTSPTTSASAKLTVTGVENKYDYNVNLITKDFTNKSATYSDIVYIDSQKPTDVKGVSDTQSINFDGKEFFKELPTITITSKDDGVGIGKIVVYKDNTPIYQFFKDNISGALDKEYPTDNISALDSDVSFKVDSSGEYSVEVIDIVGNTTGITGISSISSLSSDYLVVDTKKPTISATKSSSSKTNWYSSDIEYSISFEDETGLKEATATINGQSVDSFKEEQSGVLTKKFTVSTSGITANKDGSYSIVVKVKDTSNNEAEWSDTVYIDRSKPVISKLVFSGEGHQDGTSAKDDYGLYFKDKASCDVYVDDGEVSSGLNKVYYTFKSSSNKETKGEVAITGGSAKIKIPKDFKGWLYVYADDNVGNQSATESPDGIILEDSKTALNSIDIGINLPETPYKDKSGNNLYSKKVDITVNVKSSISGVRELEWGINDEKRGTAKIDNNGKVSDNNVVIKEKDKNLIVTLVDAIDSADNNNKNKVWVKVTDRVGLESTAEKIFSIDKDKPVVSVSYSPNKNKYYNTTRTATITVKERNFDPKKVSITGKKGSLGTWSSDGDTHTVKMTFSKDGDYNINVSATDLAGNSSNIVTGDKFTIDKTKPNISVNWSNSAAKNGKYYKTSRTATIVVKEHNFNPSDIKVTGGNVGRWSNNGDTHTASVSFSTNGKYKLSISGQDRAGNTGASYSSEEFIIDLDKPKLTVSGVQDGVSYHKDVEATVSASDTNLDTKLSNVTITGRRNGKLDLTGGFTVSGGTVKLVNLPDEEKWDDYYTLKATAVDMAGNSDEIELSFSINRKGSSYKCLSTEYLNTYSNTKKDIKISESNVDEVDTSKSKVVITLDGEEIEVPQNVVAVSSKGIVDGKNNYEYVIDKSAFTKDGKYVIQLYSTSKDGTESNSLSQEYSFVLDTTNPDIIISGVKDGVVYNEYKRDVTVEVRDLSGVKDIEIKVNGEIVNTIEENGIFKLAIPESANKQSISVTVTDNADNVVTNDVTDFIITSNKLTYLSHQWWFWLILGLVAFVIIAILALIVASRSKKSKQLDRELESSMEFYNTTSNVNNKSSKE